MTIAYHHPDFSNKPRLVLPITFCSPSSTSILLTPPPSPSTARNTQNHQSFAAIHDFLQLWPEDAEPPYFVLETPATCPSTLRGISLGERLGEGRTGTVWRVETVKQNPVGPRQVAKVFSRRHLASFVREFCFYVVEFPRRRPPLPVPKFHGAYASVCGGWYVLLLEYVGVPVEGCSPRLPLGDEETKKAIWCGSHLPLLLLMLHKYAIS